MALPHMTVLIRGVDLLPNIQGAPEYYIQFMGLIAQGPRPATEYAGWPRIFYRGHGPSLPTQILRSLKSCPFHLPSAKRRGIAAFWSWKAGAALKSPFITAFTSLRHTPGNCTG